MPTVDLNSCAGDVLLVHADAAVVAADYAALRALQPSLFEVELDAAAEAAGADAPAGSGAPAGAEAGALDIELTTRRLAIEAAEAMRIASAVAQRGAATSVSDASADAGASAEGLVTLRVRFPLVADEYSLCVAPDSVAATSGAAVRPRELGARLLSAVRTARDEATAVAHCEELLLGRAGRAAVGR